MPLQMFRIVAFIEGVTTILLFMVAMPLKYALDYPALIRPVGWFHGMAWLAYLAAMVLCLPGKRFGMLGWLRTFIAALFPFGTFLNDPFVRRRQAERLLRSGAENGALST